LDQTTKDVEARLRKAKESGHKIVDDDTSLAEYFPIKIDRKDLPEEKKSNSPLNWWWVAGCGFTR